MVTPCKGCLERSPVCHAKCERYRAYAEQRQELLKKKFMEGEAGGPSIMRAKLHDRWLKNFRRSK